LGLQRDRTRRRGGQQCACSRNDAARAGERGPRAGAGAIVARFHAGAPGTAPRAGSAEVERASSLPAGGHSERTVSGRTGSRTSGRGTGPGSGCAACRGATCAGKSFRITCASPDCGATIDVFRRGANGDIGSAAERGCFQRTSTGSANGRAADASCSRTATGRS